MPHIAGLYLTSGVCGLVDAACYLSLGEVFAEMMTGNLLLICFYTGSGQPILEQTVYLYALGAFALGAISGGRIVRGPRGETRFGFKVEWALLVLALLLSMTVDPVASTAGRDAVISTLAFAMGLQNALLRKHGVPDLATNVMTLTLTAFFAETSLAGGRNERWRRRLGSVTTFMAGATLGALLTLSIGPWAPLMVAVFTVALLGLTNRDPAEVR